MKSPGEPVQNVSHTSRTYIKKMHGEPAQDVSHTSRTYIKRCTENLPKTPVLRSSTMVPGYFVTLQVYLAVFLIPHFKGVLGFTLAFCRKSLTL
ncbi:hypothetical protein RRG08_005634 [Elysia crispata]|uniref:Uncharacterized protein n=1 Tax=Elysia crispata TaxID=231223 RepID=A0AAE0YXJ2_9GAST|nr:hypothetical protein RRG08_005634 [Elysia crispata]